MRLGAIRDIIDEFSSEITLIYRYLREDRKEYKLSGQLIRASIELERILQSGAWGIVEQAQSLPSDESLLIQLADVLTGAVAAAYNKEIKSQSKTNIKALIDYHIGHSIRATFPSETKFNVFKIKLRKKLW